MAIVIHRGKRYHLSMFHVGDRYQLLRYGPMPDASGRVDENDLIFIIHEYTHNFTIECDGDDATELDRIVKAHNEGLLTPGQFEEMLAEFVRETLSGVSAEDAP